MAKLIPCFVAGCQRLWMYGCGGEVQVTGPRTAKRCSVCGFKIRKEPKPDTPPKLLKKA